VTKTELVNVLIEEYRCRRFLEISTPTTGYSFTEIQGSSLDVRHRLIYNYPEYCDDGYPHTFRTSQPFSYELVKRVLSLNDGKPAYDIVFLDPYHTYRCSRTDLRGAFALLEPGGVVIVHDCGPTDPSTVSPDFVEGSWCGETYAAFIDLTFGRDDVSYYTVDCDFGCGVVYKPPRWAPFTNRRCRENVDRLLYQWDIVRDEPAKKFELYQKHRSELLNLISPEEFLTIRLSRQAQVT
jgi:hypothetical protein